MIDIDEAYRVLFEHVTPGPVVELPLSEALYRTLASPISCDVDMPPFDRSVMDGYAVRAADVADAPLTLQLVGEAPAGAIVERAIGAGEAMHINTGAPIPPGADAVVRVEETEPREGAVWIKTSVPVGHFITRRGAYVSARDIVMEAGLRLTPAGIAAAATAGAARVSVRRRPRVSILTTGDELVDVDQKPVDAQIRNSNQFLLEALARSAHAGVTVLPVVRDDRDRLEASIREGLEADVLCVSGGVSMGDRDFVPEVLAAVGATFHIHKIAIKPGRPTIFASTPSGTLVFALPGNPVSAFVGFELLVRPALRAWEGGGASKPALVAAAMVGGCAAARDRQTYLPARAWVDARGQWCVERVSWGGSGDSLGLAAANAMIVRVPEAPEVPDGSPVSVMLLDPVCDAAV